MDITSPSNGIIYKDKDNLVIEIALDINIF